ncbi:MAG: hypothetical protein RL333_2176 [Pseudomonadota bacterium]|jgi:hypothetical protein
MVCLFILAAAASLVFFVANRPRILIIQSQSAESTRSREFKAGWSRALNEKHILAKVSWHSLEQDLHPGFETQTLGALRTIELEDPDLIVLVDDLANDRIGRTLASVKTTSLLFVGIDQSPDYYGYIGNDQISGIVEQLRLEPFHELISILFPESKLKYGVIGIDNPSGRARMNQLKNCSWSQHVLSDSALVDNFTDWKKFIEDHRDVDVLLVLNTAPMMEKKGGESEIVPLREVINWTEVNSRPVPIGIEAGYVTNGGGLAIEQSPRRFGEMAAIRTKEWLNPKPILAQDMHAMEFQVAICLSRLSERKLDVPSIYVESARLSGTLFP